MNPHDDDPIDALLRAQFEGPVPDDGFSERVMQALPPRRRRVDWPVRAGIAAAVVTCWASLQSTSVLHEGWSAWASGRLTAPAIALLLAIAGMSLLALWWSVAEGGEA